MMRDNSRPAGPAWRGVGGRRRSISWSSPEPPPDPPARTDRARATLIDGALEAEFSLDLDALRAAPNAPTTGPNRMGQPNPTGLIAGWAGCLPQQVDRGRVVLRGYQRLVVGRCSLIVQGLGCSAGAHHRGAGDRWALARPVFATLHSYGLRHCALGRTPDRPSWAVRAAAISGQAQPGPPVGPARGAVLARVCRPEVLQEAAEASGGAIGGTISPKEISAAVTFAPRRCCLLTEMVPLGLQSPIGQERSSVGNQDGHDVCVGP
jgi:hypothetical protein